MNDAARIVAHIEQQAQMQNPSQNGKGLSSGESGFPPAPAHLREAAFHGPAGEFVRTIEPHTEADPAATLIQFLLAFGNACGRGPGFRVESDEHGTNEFAAIVGDTVEGRARAPPGATCGARWRWPILSGRSAASARGSPAARA